MSAKRCLMISPVNFSFNDAAGEDNEFMKNEEGKNYQTKVLEEHSNFVELLKKHGVEVSLFSHSKETPDAVFPNNWFSTHRKEDGTTAFCLYPMKVPNRRLERTDEIITFLRNAYKTCFDFSKFEDQGVFLEGTGSFVADWFDSKIYVALSQRSNEKVVEEICSVFSAFYERKFEAVTFQTKFKDKPVYHTNVVLSIGEKVAIVCFDVIKKKDRKKVREHLSKKKIVEISEQQMVDFCGNVIELQNEKGQKLLVLSDTSLKSFTDEQKKVFKDFSLELVHSDLSTLERLGGGGIRCCIAELF